MAILCNYNQFLRVKYHQSQNDSVLNLGKRRKQMLEQSQVSLNCLLLNYYLLLSDRNKMSVHKLSSCVFILLRKSHEDT